MRKIFFLFLFPLNVFAQTNTQLEELKDLSYKSITSTIKEASDYYSCENLRGNAICFENLEAALLLDVFKYYNLEDQYPSALKKATYMETQDYKDKLNKLKIIKTEYTNQNLYIELNKTEEFKVFDYDLSKGGFYIRLGFMVAEEANFYNKYYLINQLPTKLFISDLYSPTIYLQKMYDRIFFFPIRKEKALQIENNSTENIKMLMLFKPMGIKKVKLSFPLEYQNFATTDKFRLLILNQSTSAVYYDKVFPTVKETKKK